MILDVEKLVAMVNPQASNPTVDAIALASVVQPNDVSYVAVVKGSVGVMGILPRVCSLVSLIRK